MRLRLAIILLLGSCWTIFAQNGPPTHGELTVVRQFAPETYPAAARAVMATGEVDVAVNIDPDGKVISAVAYSGHPFLRKASEDAAATWQFSPVGKDVPLRSTVLLFTFKIDTKQIEESEKDDETTVSRMFPSMFSAELAYETIIPKLLLLPREKGVIKPEICDLHNEPMSVEIQAVDCASNDSRPSFERTEEYNEAENKDFPNAHTEDNNDCRNNGVQRVEVYFCRTCRIARSNWLQINN